MKEEKGFEKLDEGEILRVNKMTSCAVMKKIIGMIAEYKKCLDKRPFSKDHMVLSVAIR